MSAILDLRTAPRKPVLKKNGTGIDTKLKAMFDQVREEARKVPAGKRIRDVSALIEKGRRYGA